MKNRKSLGQHWLKDRDILLDISNFAAADGVDTVVEIGPGLGTLTSTLFKNFDKVIAIELDNRLAENLPKSFPGTNLEVIRGDILEYDFSSIKEPYVIAGNIPYYITSPIIEKVLTCVPSPKRVVLLIQKEVAERILSDKETVLSLFVKNRARVFAGPVVKAEEFTPPPKVDSQVVVFEPFEVPIVSDEVFDLIKQGFRAPRKKLIHNLAGLRSKEELIDILKEIGVSADTRPGDLKLNNWGDLYEKIYSKNRKE